VNIGDNNSILYNIQCKPVSFLFYEYNLDYCPYHQRRRKI
jgi:hypothetical protein